jgi:hypothetical protein
VAATAGLPALGFCTGRPSPLAAVCAVDDSVPRRHAGRSDPGDVLRATRERLEALASPYWHPGAVLSQRGGSAIRAMAPSTIRQRAPAVLGGARLVDGLLRGRRALCGNEGRAQWILDSPDHRARRLRVAAVRADPAVRSWIAPVLTQQTPVDAGIAALRHLIGTAPAIIEGLRPGSGVGRRRAAVTRRTVRPGTARTRPDLPGASAAPRQDPGEQRHHEASRAHAPL